ncbi:MAG: class I SAM-dependent methyltransferase [Candidatus Bathyarchaeia archaeon]|jgi:16S rRNA (guanine1207-N2)-methyltransferase
MAKDAKNIEHYFVANPKSRPRYGLIRTYLRGKPFEFLTASGVFSKQRVDLGTRLLIESMLLPKKGCALDIGCGYGAVGIGAAAFNPRLYVILVDVNARAVWLARQNVEKNIVSNAEVRRGCLYAPVKDLIFDCVLSNPPVSAGMETVKAMIVEAPRHMACGGVFQMVVKSKIGGKRLRTIFEEAFGNVEVLARESGYRVLLSRRQ